MPNALVALANITLSTSQTTVTFSSISQSYKDLYLVIEGASAGGGGYPLMRFNGSSATNYSYVNMYALANNSRSSGTAANVNGLDVGLGWANYQSSPSIPSTYVINIMDYATTDKHKSMIIRSNAHGNTNVSNNGVVTGVARWALTNAITSLSLTATGVNFGSGASFALYGVS